MHAHTHNDMKKSDVHLFIHPFVAVAEI
jgi:nitrate reductase alpha subunit